MKYNNDIKSDDNDNEETVGNNDSDDQLQSNVQNRKRKYDGDVNLQSRIDASGENDDVDDDVAAVVDDDVGGNVDDDVAVVDDDDDVVVDDVVDDDDVDDEEEEDNDEDDNNYGYSESDVHNNDIVDDYASMYEMRDDFISQMQQAGCPRGTCYMYWDMGQCFDGRNCRYLHNRPQQSFKQPNKFSL